eukprot:3029_1
MAFHLMQLLLAIVNLLSLQSLEFVWRQYQNYGSDLSFAYHIEYELSLSQCFDLCTNDSSSCMGITWYADNDLKRLFANAPSRCYLLRTIYDLKQELSTLTPITAVWYTNITQETCIDYPYDWADEWGDTCSNYRSSNVCDNAFNDSSKEYILENADNRRYDLHAFQTCCDCSGSLYEYGFFQIEAIWKPPYINSIDNIMVCQSYNQSSQFTIDSKLSLHEFIGICDFSTSQNYAKYDIIYSLSSNENEDIELAEFDCVDNNVFIDSVNEYYICDQFDHNSYPYILDIDPLNSQNYTAYVNSYLVDTDNLQTNNNIRHKTKCNIDSLINNNSESNILTSLICEYNFVTPNPTSSPTLQPTPMPNYPTRMPTYDCYSSHSYITNEGAAYCYHLSMNLTGAVFEFTAAVQHIYTGSHYTNNRMNYYPLFIAKTNDCLEPRLTVRYTQIRYTSSSTALYVYAPSTSGYIKRCYSSDKCALELNCVSEYDLGIARIPKDSSYEIRLYQNSNPVSTYYQSSEYCYYHLGNYMINATVTIHCSDPTASPTTQPTANPTTHYFPVLWMDMDNYTCNDL